MASARVEPNNRSIASGEVEEVVLVRCYWDKKESPIIIIWLKLQYAANAN